MEDLPQFWILEERRFNKTLLIIEGNYFTLNRAAEGGGWRWREGYGRERCIPLFCSDSLTSQQQLDKSSAVGPHASLLAPAGGRLAARAAAGERRRGMRAPRPLGDDLVLAAVLEAVGR